MIDIESYTDLSGNQILVTELNWLQTGIDIDGQPCDRYSTNPETSVWLDDYYQEVEVV